MIMPVPRLILRCFKALIVAYLIFKAIDIVLNFQEYWDPNPFHGKPYAWKSSYSGWYARSAALNISEIQDIRFDPESLLLISSSSAWGNSIFHAAIFKPGICVLKDEARRLDDKDFEGFVRIVKEVGKNKRGKSYWNMNPRVVDLSTDLLRIREMESSGESGYLKPYGAYALNKFVRVRGSAKMPKVMAELFGLVDSDEICCRPDGERDEIMEKEVGRLKHEIMSAVKLRGGDELGYPFGPGRVRARHPNNGWLRNIWGE